MSFEQQLAAAVAAARTFQQCHNLLTSMWAAYDEKLIDDAIAQSTSEAVEERRRAIASRVAAPPKRLTSALPRRSAPRSPDRQRSIERRRACAASGAVPASIAARFTTSEVAVLSIIAGEVKRRGVCELPIDAVAAMAGVSRRSAQYSLRRAEQLGLICVQERPRPGRKSDTNAVTVISREWSAWLRLHRVQKSASHENDSNKHRRNTWAKNAGNRNSHHPAPVTRRERLFEKAEASTPPS